MISKTIIKYKPRVPVHQVQQQQHQVIWPYTRGGIYPTNQQEYNSYLASKTHFVTGDFVVYSNLRTPINGFYQIHLIVHVEKDYNFVKKMTRTGKPEPFLLHSLVFMDPAEPPRTAWIRFEDGDDHRLLTAEEYDKWIKPNNDKLQDYLKKARKQFEGGAETNSSD